LGDKRSEAKLSAAGIAYVFLGKELGGRPDDPSCHENGRVQYERVAPTALFAEGMRRLEDGANRYRVALMCAEKDPLACHRTLLVAREAPSGVGAWVTFFRTAALRATRRCSRV
jgi:hypothetical protein